MMFGYAEPPTTKRKIIFERSLKRIRFLFFFLFIIICSSMPFYIGLDRTGRAAAGCLLIILFWVFLILPLPATSLLPIFIFPVTGVLSTEDVCNNYFKSIIFLLIGGMLIALAFEYSQLHRRFALWCLKVIGTSQKMLLLGFMIPTCVLSLLINNTSTTAIMLPIADAVFEELSTTTENKEDSPSLGISIVELEKLKDQSETSTVLETYLWSYVPDDTSVRSTVDNAEKEEQSPRALSRALLYEKECIFISIAMAANIGGTGTILGTGSNVILMETLAQMGKFADTLNYFNWMLFAIPNLIICMIASWIWLLGYFYGFKKLFTCHHEIIVIIAFSLLSVVWITRSLIFIQGWSSLMFAGADVGDATLGMLIGIMLMVIPRRFDCFCCKLKDSRKDFPASPTLPWRIIHKKFPWSALLIIGAGLCLADAVLKSGLSNWVSNGLKHLKDFRTSSISTLTIITTHVMTTFMANTAVVSIMLPILRTLSESLRIHPLYLMLPVTLCASQAFMFPFSTPPNTLVFEWGHLKFSRLAGQGFGLNVLCGMIMILMINTFGVLVYDLNNYPE